ncbi:MAG TPA: hypothetical protein VGB38_00750, partial [bacterium]
WAHPVLDVSVSCPQLDLKTFFSHMSPGLRGAASGQARFDLRMSGSPQNPSVRGRFGAEKFRAAGLTLRRFDCRFELKDSVLVFEGRNPPETGLGFRLDGKLDMSGENKASYVFAELNGDWMDGVPAWLQKRTEAFEGGLACRFQGTLQKLTGTVNGKLFVTPKGGPHTVLNPELNYKDQRFGVSLRSDQAFRVEGEVLSPLRHDARWNATVRGCEWLLAFLPEGRLNRKAEGLELSLFMNGNAREWMFEANGIRPGREFPRALQAVLVSKTRRENRREYDFKATVFGPKGDALPFEARMVSTPDGFIIQQGEIGKWIFMQGQFPRQANEPVKAELRLEDLDLSKLHPTFPELRPFFARINGRLQVSGTKSKSIAHLELAMRKGKFHDVDGFEGEATCEWIGKVFHSGRLDIQKNRLPLLVGEFLPTRGDSVIGKIQSGNLLFGELTKAWTGRKNVLNGEGAFNFNIAGPGLEPIVTGSIHVRNGSIGNISFSEFNAEVTDTLQDPTGPAGGTCLIRNGVFVRDDGLHVEFWGLIPHGGERSADVSVSARGNLLGFLSETNDFIKKSRGTGEVF